VLSKEFIARGGSAPLVRFFLGVFAMIGCLVFLGCTWRIIIRIGGGDLNGLTGLAGMFTGVGLGSACLKKGFTLGTPRPMPAVSGILFPAIMGLFLLLLIFGVSFKTGQAVFSSAKGPGSMHAALLVSLIAGLIIGGAAQRTRFCTIAGIRDLMIDRRFPMLLAAAAFLFGVLGTNLVLGRFKLGMTAMPISHSSLLWNFLGMVLAGFAFCLARGCPGRQLILAGEGDTDAGIFVLGMFAGAAFAHNWFLAAVPDRIVEDSVVVGGPGSVGIIAVLIGLLFCFIVGFTSRKTDHTRISEAD
jgi:YedE family putative selenium metabolism protein